MHTSTHPREELTFLHVPMNVSSWQAAYIRVLFLCAPVYTVFWRLIHLLFDHASAPLTALSSMVVERQIHSALPPSSRVVLCTAATHLSPALSNCMDIHSDTVFNILTILHRPQACSNPSSDCQDWLDLLLRSLRWLSMSLHMVSGPPLPSSS